MSRKYSEARKSAYRHAESKRRAINDRRKIGRSLKAQMSPA